MLSDGGVAPKLVSMSAMGIGDSKNQMKASNWFMGRLTLWLVIPYMLKSCFDDLEAGERIIETERSEAGLNMTIIRAPVLKDNKNYRYGCSGWIEHSQRLILSTFRSRQCIFTLL